MQSQELHVLPPSPTLESINKTGSHLEPPLQPLHRQESTSTATRKMKPKQKTSALTLPLATGNLMLLAMLMGLLVASIQAIDQKSVKPSAAAPSSSRDSPIYIDDDSIEGSGGRGGIHDDLEKDPDYSGSGFGPDDEDAEPDHHSHGSHNSQHSQNGAGGGASINSKHNSNDFSKNGKNSNSDLISSRYNNNNNHNQIDNSQNINLNNNNNNNHQTNSGTIIGSSTTANNNHNININSQNGIISGSEIGGHSTGINSIAAHTPTDTSSTISTPTTANWNTTTTTTTTTATPTTTSASSPTTTTAATNNNNGPTNSISGQRENDTDIFRQPEMPIFDPHVDTEGSGDSHDDDDDDGDFDADNDNDNDDDGDGGDDEYDYADRNIDAPGTRTDDEVKPEDEIPTNNHDFTDFDKDTIDLDEDIKKEDVVPDVGGAAGGAVDGVSTRTDFGPVIGRGNDGGSNPEREPGAGGNSNVHALDPNTNVNSQPSDTKSTDHRGNGNEVVIMSEDDRTSSFFSQPGILAAVIGGAVVGLLCAILVVMFIVYRMRKKDEGSYALDEPKRSPANNSYAKNANNREFYA
ncbi:syndecan isoform X1 [Drosophila bipectinata]